MAAGIPTNHWGRFDRFVVRALRPVSGESAAAFRVVFGVIGLVIALRLFAFGWIDELYVQPSYHFSYPGFEWVRPWPQWLHGGMYLHFAALAALSVAIAVGYRYRVAAVLYFIGFTYVELIDRTTYLNHHYWIVLAALLIVFLPLDRRGSVRLSPLPRFRSAVGIASLWRRDPTPGSPTIPAWTIWALRAQVGVVYLFAGVAKLNPDWLFDAQPIGIWLYQHGEMPIFGPILGEPWAAYFVSWAGAAFDLTIVAWLLWRRTRFWAYLALVAFHAATAILFPRLGIFPWMMIGASLIFFPSDWPSRLLSKARARAPNARGRGSAEPAPVSSPPLSHQSAPIGSRGRKARLSASGALIMAGLGVFVLIQVLLPLRHFVYPSNVRWSEEGYLFSWRVMLTEKVGFVQYRVRDPASGRAWLVSPDEYLTPTQVERMAIQPALIQQTAHIIAADFARRGYDGVTVRADAFSSWNGRPNARLIDPGVNLAAIDPGVAPKAWILPYQAAEASPYRRRR